MWTSFALAAAVALTPAQGGQLALNNVPRHVRDPGARADGPQVPAGRQLRALLQYREMRRPIPTEKCSTALAWRSPTVAERWSSRSAPGSGSDELPGREQRPRLCELANWARCQAGRLHRQGYGDRSCHQDEQERHWHLRTRAVGIRAGERRPSPAMRRDASRWRRLAKVSRSISASPPWASAGIRGPWASPTSR